MAQGGRSMDLFHRHPANPVFTIEHLPFPAIAVYNPGVAEVNGEVMLLLRVEGDDGLSALYVARSKNGVDDWQVEPTPLISPADVDSPYEEQGCEDPRVTWVEELGCWVIAYVAAGNMGATVALATTTDWEQVQRKGIVLPPSNKNAMLFPRRINGKWMLLNRPSDGGATNIWVVESDDLLYWGNPKRVLGQRSGSWWDGARVGGGAVPIETPDGWLMIYHGVKMVAGIHNYRLGVALLDLDDPSKVIARCDHPVFSPNTPYERVGHGMNVVFTCGAFVRGDEVWLYYGAADTCIGLATAKLDDLLQAARGKNG